MNSEQRLERIIEKHLPALRDGQETIDSIVNLYPKDAVELGPRLEAALWLCQANMGLSPRSGFIPSTRTYLEKRISSMPHQHAWQRLINRYSPQRWIFNIVSPIILIMLLVLVINSLVLSAQLSLPGDPLYSTKLAIEDVQVALTFNPEKKTDLYIQFSRERTTEFVELVLEGDYAQLPSAADRMETDLILTLHSLNRLAINDHTTESPMVANLRETFTSEVVMLNLLKETSPSSAHTGIDLAIQVSRSGILALH